MKLLLEVVLDMNMVVVGNMVDRQVGKGCMEMAGKDYMRAVVEQQLCLVLPLLKLL